jgi:hypothetical protein
MIRKKTTGKTWQVKKNFISFFSVHQLIMPINSIVALHWGEGLGESVRMSPHPHSHSPSFRIFLFYIYFFDIFPFCLFRESLRKYTSIKISRHGVIAFVSKRFVSNKFWISGQLPPPGYATASNTNNIISIMWSWNTSTINLQRNSIVSYLCF